MDNPFRVEPRKIEFTTYGPARAPVWTVTFALHASSGYEHHCTVVVPGLGHDDVTDICGKARAELIRIASLIAADVGRRQDEPDERSASAPGARGSGRRSRRAP